MKEKPVFVVDLDNTLWSLSVPLHERLARYFDVPEDAKWDKWESYLEYGISDENFYKTVGEIHRLAGIFPGEYPPYTGAKELMEYLNHLGTVIVATHRDTDLLRMTSNYLWQWGLNAPGLYVGWDKTFLYTDNAIVIDDSPKNIQIAIGRGIPVLSLRHSWNKDMALPLFDDLNGVYEYISGMGLDGKTNGGRRQPRRI